jgi:hypothetical protein
MAATLSPGGAGEEGYYELAIVLVVDDMEAERFARLLREMGWEEDAEDIEQALVPATPSVPEATFIGEGRTHSGKPYYRYTVTGVESLRDAMDALPEEDFLVHWWNQDRTTINIEVVRMF